MPYHGACTPLNKDQRPHELLADDGGLKGIGYNNGRGFAPDGSGPSWRSDGQGGYEGTGEYRKRGYKSDGRGGYIGTGNNRGERWKPD